MARDKLGLEYESRRHLYESLVDKLRDLISDLLKRSSTPVAQIEGRAKEVRSFVEKVDRKNYDDPFRDMKDLVGLRVVTYYHDDVHRVAELIRKEFVVDDEHSTDKVLELGVDEFGYRSFHLVCTLGSNRSKLPEWGSFAGMSFEVQVRSVLQHAWAAISHKLDYKSAAEAPQPLRRQLFRLSALLELADDEFVRIRDQTQSIAERYQDDVDQGNLTLPLDLESLRRYVTERVELTNWVHFGIDSGMRRTKRRKTWFTEDAQRRLHAVLRAIGVSRLEEIDPILEASRQEAASKLEALNTRSSELGYQVWAEPFDVMAFTVALGQQERLPPGFVFPNLRDEIEQAFKDVRGEQ